MVVTQQQINNLPINGRNFISFSVITPGVTRDNTPQQGASATSGLTFAGQRARSNNITVDGLDNNDIVGRQRPGDVQPGGGAGVPGRHQLVLGGVRQGVRRRRQHRHEERHEQAKRQRVLLLPRLGAQREERTSSASRRPATRSTATKAPYGQKQFGGIFGGPIKKDRTFFFGSFERLDVDDQQLRRHRRHHASAPVRPAAWHCRGHSSSARVSRRDRQRAVRGQIQPAAVEARSTDSRRISSWLRYNYADGLNENIEPWGGLVARSRGAVAATTRTTCLPRHTPRFCRVENRQRAAVPVRAPRSEGQFARSQLRRSLHGRGSGRPDARDSRRRQRRPPALHAAAATQRPLSGARHDQPVPRQSSVESGVRLQLRRSQAAVAAAAFRRTISLPAAAGNSRTPADADHRHPGAGAGPARRLHPGIRQFLGNLWIQRSVAFRAGRLARIRQGDAEDGRPLPESVLARHAAEHARSADAVRGSARQQQHRAARRGIVGRPPATRRRSCTGPTGSTTTT